MHFIRSNEKMPAEKIQSIVLTSVGSQSDYSNLKIKEEEYPQYTADEVIVRVKACGLNFAELLQRQGVYRPAPETPYTPGFEASGIVEKVGQNITNLKVNDRVIVNNASNMWKEVIVSSRAKVFKMPESMTFE